MLEEFLRLLQEQVDSGIYVWGGNGERLNGMAEPEKWIRKHETSAENGKRAVALYQKRLAAGKTDIRAFDCSGLVHYAMKKCGARRGDLSSRGFHAACKKIAAAAVLPGDLLFRRNGKGVVCHVGVYVGGGYTVECYGRDVGVITRKLADRWSDFGRYGALAAEQEALAAEPGTASAGQAAPGRRTLCVSSPLLRGEDVKKLQSRLVDLGFGVGEAGIDGVYGTDSAAAVRRFKEQAAALTVDETADEALLRLLGLWG